MTRSPLPWLLSLLLFLSGFHPFTARAAEVREFGAKGDGVADDTAAVEKAIEGGSVEFSKGVYRITRTITVDLAKTGFSAITSDGTARIVMAGAGPAFRIVGTHDGTADPKTVKPEVWDRQRSPRVSGIEIVGDHLEADGIEATGTMQLTISDVTIRKARHAIHLTNRNRNVLIAECHLYENSGCGVFLDQVSLHQINIANCHISYNRGGGVVSRGGDVRNLHIGTCDIESNMGPDAPATANVLIDCTGGSTAEVAITGCTIQHNSKSPGSANIRFIGSGVLNRKKPEPTQEGHLTITGNVFSDVMVNIHLQHVRGASITGNSFWEGFEHDLLIEDSDSIVIGPNDFDRNPRYSVNGNWAKDRNGIVLRRCTDSKLEGLLVKGVWQQPAGVLLEQCRRVTVQNCSVLDCDGVALSLKDSEGCMVSGCMLRDDRAEKKATHSLRVEGGKENWIIGNWLPDGTEGLSDDELRLNRR